MAAVIQAHPRLLGIGIDEATALVVTGSRAEVIGEYAVHFFRKQDGADALGTPAGGDAGGSQPGSPPGLGPEGAAAAGGYLAVPAGKTIDLKTLDVSHP